MRLATWIRTFRPIKNHLNANAPDGIMFETFGAELDFVRAQPAEKVWTITDGDNGGLYIGTGYSLVNRMGYLVTERSWSDPDHALCVTWSAP